LNRLKLYYGNHDLHFVTFSCYRSCHSWEDLVRVAFLSRSWNESEPSMGDAGARAPLAQRTRERYALGGAAGTEAAGFALAADAHDEIPRKRALRGIPGGCARIAAVLANARFYDFNVYSLGKLREKLHYMHANPVIRRLVKHPQDWPWSSWSNYAHNGQGLLPVDRM
jgi:hypothetical protein